MEREKYQPGHLILLLRAALVVALLTAGCSQLGGQGKGSAIPEVYTGTRGFEVAFAPESVPSVMTGGSSSDVLLLISNKGAVDVDVSNIIINVGDNSRAAISFEKPVMAGEEILDQINKGKNPEDRLGKNLAGRAANGVGTLESIKLTATAKGFEKSEDAVNTGLLATACYQYNTKLTANVCVDAAPYSFQKQRKPCDANAPLVFQSQGAPVAVKRINVLAPDKSGGFVRPKFKIYIGDVGNGLVIGKSADSLKAFCTNEKVKSDVRTAINVVWLDDVELNGRGLNRGIECNDKDKDGKKKPIILTGKLEDDSVLCTYQANDFTDGSGVFATPLKVGLSYGYRSTSDPVQVRVEKGIS